MRNKLLIAAGAILAILAVLVVIISMQPGDFVVQRSVTIAAPPQRVFSEVNDFHRWEAWSPWAKIDPKMTSTYEGPAAGEGAIYTWNGTGDVGAGRMTILESKPGALVKIKLEFSQPMVATNIVDFTFTPNGDKTDTTWKMAGPTNFASKAFGLVMSMDKMVGGMFEQGLGDLKKVSEAPPVAAAQP